jgi:hypothetical protein
MLLARVVFGSGGAPGRRDRRRWWEEARVPARVCTAVTKLVPSRCCTSALTSPPRPQPRQFHTCLLTLQKRSLPPHNRTRAAAIGSTAQLYATPLELRLGRRVIVRSA